MPGGLVDAGINPVPEPVERHDVRDVDPELRVPAEVAGIKVVEVNAPQAQRLGGLCTHLVLSFGSVKASKDRRDRRQGPVRSEH